jgi:hypothetical protein
MSDEQLRARAPFIGDDFGYVGVPEVVDSQKNTCPLRGGCTEEPYWSLARYQATVCHNEASPEHRKCPVYLKRSGEAEE